MKVKILVVDDSAFSRRTMRRHLEELGHFVEDVPDGLQALERITVHPPELVFLDLVMPGLSGTEVLEKILEIAPDTPVIVATSDVQKATSDEVRLKGAKALINKPVTRQNLEMVLTTVLRGGSSWS